MIQNEYRDSNGGHVHLFTAATCTSQGKLHSLRANYLCPPVRFARYVKGVSSLIQINVFKELSLRGVYVISATRSRDQHAIVIVVTRASPTDSRLVRKLLHTLTTLRQQNYATYHQKHSTASLSVATAFLR